MKISQNVGPVIWGAIGGAIATMVVGFAWGGWVTGGSAESMVRTASRDAVVSALAPICVLQFNAQPAAASELIALKGLGHYAQSDFVEKSGAAKMPGSEASANGVAQACADLLVKAAT